MSDRPLLLLSNDDGHQARGILLLREALSRFAEVILCAPETEQSATSHSLSLHRPLRLRQVSPGVFAVDGTPADCVYVALHADKRVLPRRPDMVVSGLNHGVNLGADAFYSGTVGAAREGALRGIPALAASADGRSDQKAAAALAALVAERLLAQASERPHDARAPLLMNLNIPPGPGPWELKKTVLGARFYEERVAFARDPRGREYLWIGGASHSHVDVAGSDTEAFDAGVASLTPLVLDLTCSETASFAGALVSSVSRAR